jgi:hypothetical protein
VTGEPARPPALRVSDAERELVADRLRHAAGEGRLTVEELDERVGRVYLARTETDLIELTADLPPAAEEAPARAPARRRSPRRWLFSIMGGDGRRGRWRVGRRLSVIAVMGGVDLDLREAVIEEGETTITMVALMGGVHVIVPPGVDVEVTGFDFMGGRDVKLGSEPPRPGAPRIHIRCFCVMGGADVKTRARKARAELPPPPPPPPLGP